MVTAVIQKPLNNPHSQNVLLETIKHWWIYVVLFLIIGGLILFALIKIMQYLKEKKNPLISMFKEKSKLAKQHRLKQYYKSFFNPKKNAVIEGQYFLNGQFLTTKLGYYYGHYITSTGDINLLFARNNIKKWLVLPDIKMLLLNLNSDKVIEYFDKAKNETIKQKFSLPSNYVKFTEDRIILLGVSSVDVLDEDNLFYFPVLMNNKQGVDNLRFYFHESIKEPLLSSQYMNTLNFFINANKKIVEFNPFIKAKQKLDDNNTSIDTQTEQ